MKRLTTLISLMTVLTCMSLAEVQKMDRLPALFMVRVETVQRTEGRNEKYIQKEYLITANEAVNTELRAVADELDACLTPLIRTEPNGNAINYSRLDIETSYARTGQSWLSTLTIARVSWRREQTELDFRATVYDLGNGQRIGLRDLFPQESPAWEMMSARAKEHLTGVFPSEERDSEKINALCSLPALQDAAFSLGGAELTLHFLARDIGLSEPGMIHVRFFYPEFQGMMTPEGLRGTDNRHWKMVALTFDDGPRYFNSLRTLTSLRQGGARATFFTVGHLYEEGSWILRREFDANHLVANHSFSHKSGYVLSAEAMQRQIAFSNAILLNITGEPAKFFRAPGGLWPPWQEKGVGLPIIQWSVDTYDYSARSTKESILSIIREFTCHGDMILLHDSRTNTPLAVPLVAHYLADKAFLMVSVEELAWAEGVHMEPNVVYARFLDGRYDERRDSNLN